MFSWAVRWNRWREMLLENRSQDSATKSVIKHVSQGQCHRKKEKTISNNWKFQQPWNNISFDRLGLLIVKKTLNFDSAPLVRWLLFRIRFYSICVELHGWYVFVCLINYKFYKWTFEEIKSWAECSCDTPRNGNLRNFSDSMQYNFELQHNWVFNKQRLWLQLRCAWALQYLLTEYFIRKARTYLPG